MATQMVTAGTRISEGISTTRVSAEAIGAQEPYLYCDDQEGVGEEHILMASKLYTQYVQPE